MKAIAIVALVFAALSIIIPVIGVFLALLCSVLAMIAFRSETTLAGVTFGINIVNTAFLSPFVYMSDMQYSNTMIQNMDRVTSNTTSVSLGESGDLYWVYVGFHLALLTIAIVWRLVRGAPGR